MLLSPKYDRLGSWLLPSGLTLYVALEVTGRKRKLSYSIDIGNLEGSDREKFQQEIYPDICLAEKLIEARYRSRAHERKRRRTHGTHH